VFPLDFQSMPLCQAIWAYDKQAKVPVHSGRVLRWGEGRKTTILYYYLETSRRSSLLNMYITTVTTFLHHSLILSLASLHVRTNLTIRSRYCPCLRRSAHLVFYVNQTVIYLSCNKYSSQLSAAVHRKPRTASQGICSPCQPIPARDTIPVQGSLALWCSFTES
jgi:hypothetical protein